MHQIVRRYPANPHLPDHTQLPEKAETTAEHFQAHPQRTLLTGILGPVLDRLHPDGQYAIGHGAGIFYRLTNPPLVCARSPDWCYIPGIFKFLLFLRPACSGGNACFGTRSGQNAVKA